MNNLAIAHIEIAETEKPRALVNRKALAAALKTVCHTIPRRKRSAEPADHILLKAAGDTLVIEGTDLDVLARVTIPGAISPDFTALLPAHALQSIVDKAAVDTVTFETLESPWIETVETPETPSHPAQSYERPHCGKVSIGLGAANITLQSVHLSLFPELAAKFDNPNECHSFSIGASALVEAFSKCSRAVSTEETRYYLNGIYLHFSRTEVHGLSGLLAVATDGHQLVLRSIPALVPTDMPGVIIPRKTIVDLLKVLAKSKDVVKVTLTRSHIRFRFWDTVITSKLIDGTFPEYSRVIPSNNQERWELKTSTLCDSLSQLLPVATDRGRVVKLEFKGQSLGLSVNNPNLGECSTTIPATRLKDDGEFTVGLNGTYILAAAKAHGEAMEFRFNDSCSPIVITDPGDARGLSVIMPMRV